MLSRKKAVGWMGAFAIAAGGTAYYGFSNDTAISLSSDLTSVRYIVDGAILREAFQKRCSLVPNTDNQMNVESWALACGERYSAAGYYLTKYVLQIRQQKARGEYPPVPKTPMNDIYAFTG